MPRARGAARHARRWLVLSCAAIVAGALTPLTAQTPLTTDPIAAPLDEARALVGSSDPVAAQRLGEQRLTRARASGNATELMDALEYLAWVRIGRVEVAATHALLDEMRELARIESQPLWLARVLHAEGVLARRQGDTAGAIEHLEEALALRREYADQAGEIQTLNALSILRRRAGQLYLALDGHKRALELARVLDNRVEIAESLSKIGRIYVEMDDLEPALRYYQQALEVIPPEALVDRAEMLADIAGVQIAAAQLSPARQSVDEAIRLARLGSNPQTLATVYSRQARLLAAEQQPVAALQAIEQSIELGRDFDGVRSVLVRRLIRAGLLHDNGRDAEAASELAELLLEARRTEDLLSERQILELQGPVLLAVGEPAAAYAASQAFNAIDRQLNSSITARRMADMQLTLDRREIESQVALMARERDLQSLSLERQRLTLWLLLAAAGGLLLTALALAWRYRAERGMNAELQRRGEALRRAAVTDPLTGLGNRHALSALQQGLPETAAHGCLLIDVDHFKQINDSHGHPVGDRVLQVIARRIERRTPRPLQALRWGGEEFLLAGGVDAPTTLAELAEALRSEIAAKPIDTPAGALSVTVSIGHAWSAAGSGEPWASLLRRADAALYQAKDAGRNVVRAARVAGAGATVVNLDRPLRPAP
ncbi:MAG: diguanylate cyclase [Xanthomonadales bacterium]|nr:diguanylate cyclase [Xanthomonadales bacterium]